MALIRVILSPGLPVSDSHCAQPCRHRACALLRAEAAVLCSICDRPIGYDTPFYSAPNGLAHRDCVDSHLEKKA